MFRLQAVLRGERPAPFSAELLAWLLLPHLSQPRRSQPSSELQRKLQDGSVEFLQKPGRCGGPCDPSHPSSPGGAETGAPQNQLASYPESVTSGLSRKLLQLIQ